MKNTSTIGAKPAPPVKTLVQFTRVVSGKRQSGLRVFTVYGEADDVIAIVEKALRTEFDKPTKGT